MKHADATQDPPRERRPPLPDSIPTLFMVGPSETYAAGSINTLLLVLRGSALVDCGFGRFRLQRGDWIALESFAEPVIQTSRSSILVGLAVDEASALRLRNQLHDPVFFTGRGHLDNRDQLELLRHGRRMSSASRGREGLGASLHCSARALLLHIAGLQDQMTSLSERCTGHSRHRRRHKFVRLQRGKLALDGQWNRAVRISRIARECSFSLWYFTKAFHALYGMSPQRYVIGIRLEHACRMLRESSASIADISSDCGFENQCSLSRAFRANLNTTPSAYRMTIRTNAAVPCANQVAVTNPNAILNQA